MAATHVVVPCIEPVPGQPLHYDVMVWVFNLVIGMVATWRHGISGSLTQKVKEQLDTALEQLRISTTNMTLRRVQAEIENTTGQIETAVVAPEADTSMEYILSVARRVSRSASTGATDAVLRHVTRACVDVVLLISAWEEGAHEGECSISLVGRVRHHFESVKTFFLETM